MKNALALGSFDGVHLGHKSVLSLPFEYKKTAVTFKVPPKLIFSGEAALITSAEDKAETLKSLGIDEVFYLEFEKIRNMEPDEFLLFLYEKFKPSYISFGFNYRFGKAASGNAGQLIDFCKLKGIEYKCADAVTANGEVVSSTFIRGLLSAGNVKQASALMCKPFSFKAEVINGDKRGRTIGFPTINQKYPEDAVKLKFGVYKTKVLLGEEEYSGVTDIGVRPTFSSDFIISETFIKNFGGNLYGKSVRIVPIDFIREEKKFSSLEELKAQLILDADS